MFTSALFNKLLSVKSSGDQRRGRAANTTRQVRLNLESLEDRVVPAAPTANPGTTLATPAVNAIAVEAAGLVLWINAKAGVFTAPQINNLDQQLNSFSLMTTGQALHFDGPSAPWDMVQSLTANELAAGTSQSALGIAIGLNLSYNLIFQGTT